MPRTPRTPRTPPRTPKKTPQKAVPKTPRKVRSGGKSPPKKAQPKTRHHSLPSSITIKSPQLSPPMFLEGTPPPQPFSPQFPPSPNNNPFVTPPQNHHIPVFQASPQNPFGSPQQAPGLFLPLPPDVFHDDFQMPNQVNFEDEEEALPAAFHNPIHIDVNDAQQMMPPEEFGEPILFLDDEDEFFPEEFESGYGSDDEDDDDEEDEDVLVG